MNRLPKYYIVQAKLGDPKWLGYIADINEKYGFSFKGDVAGYWYGYDGNSNTNRGTDYWASPDRFVNNPTKLTLDQWEELSKEIVPTFDKDNWMVAVNNYEERKEVAEWVDARRVDCSLMMSVISDNYKYVLWYDGDSWDTQNSHESKLLISWEQFQTLKPAEPAPAPAPEVQLISREGLGVLHNRACLKWKEYIMGLLDNSPFNAFDNSPFDNLIKVPLTKIMEAYMEAEPPMKDLLRKYFTIKVEVADCNILIKGIHPKEIKEVSSLLFNDETVLTLLGASTPKDHPELKGKALLLDKQYEMRTGPSRYGGTWIAFHQKDV